MTPIAAQLFELATSALLAADPAAGSTDVQQLQPQGSFWMPPSASSFSDDIDWLFYFILWVNIFFTVLIAALMVWFPIRYMQKDRNHVAHGATHSTPLELGWSIPPLIIVLFIFAVGFKQYVDMVEAPGDATPIDVVAFQWGWEFYYPTGEKATMGTGLHLMAGDAYRFNLSAKDVLHSFFIKEFRIKKDCVPGRINMTWAQPKTATEMDLPEAGQVFEYDLFCTEYCGQGHSNMNVKVYVYTDRDQYLAALADLGGPPPNASWIEWGELLKSGNGCAACHSVDGNEGNGPTWQNLIGEPHSYTDGSSIEMTYEHMVESILVPSAKIRSSGYSVGQVMQAYNFSTPELDAFYAYMASISDQVEPWMDKPIRDDNGVVIGTTRRQWLDAGSPEDVSALLGTATNYDSSADPEAE